MMADLFRYYGHGSEVMVTPSSVRPTARTHSKHVVVHRGALGVICSHYSIAFIFCLGIKLYRDATIIHKPAVLHFLCN